MPATQVLSGPSYRAARSMSSYDSAIFIVMSNTGVLP